jgi:hypothetical protein
MVDCQPTSTNSHMDNIGLFSAADTPWDAPTDIFFWEGLFYPDIFAIF